MTLREYLDFMITQAIKANAIRMRIVHGVLKDHPEWDAILIIKKKRTKADKKKDKIAGEK